MCKCCSGRRSGDRYFLGRGLRALRRGLLGFISLVWDCEWRYMGEDGSLKERIKINYLLHARIKPILRYKITFRFILETISQLKPSPILSYLILEGGTNIIRSVIARRSNRNSLYQSSSERSIEDIPSSFRRPFRISGKHFTVFCSPSVFWLCGRC